MIEMEADEERPTREAWVAHAYGQTVLSACMRASCGCMIAQASDAGGMRDTLATVHAVHVHAVRMCALWRRGAQAGAAGLALHCAE